MNKKFHDAPLKLKAVNDDGTFSGYGSVFGVEDAAGDVVVKGAFAKSLAQWQSKGRLPALLWQHKINEPIGVYTKMVEDDYGLLVEGRLLIDDDPLARRAHAHMKAGSLTGMSIGYDFFEDGWSYDSEKGVFLLKELDLWEVSLVTFPCNDEARVDRVKSALAAGDTPSPSLVERHLRDAGFSRQQAKALMAKGYSGLTGREATGETAECIKAAQAVLNSITGN